MLCSNGVHKFPKWSATEAKNQLAEANKHLAETNKQLANAKRRIRDLEGGSDVAGNICSWIKLMYSSLSHSLFR